VFQRCANRPKHSANRPVFSVGFPKASHAAPGVVIAPSVTSHMLSAIVLASSNNTSTFFSCVPAKLCELCSDHGIAFAYHVSGNIRCLNVVAAQVNQCALMLSRCHFASSRHVFVESCASVFAVTTTCG